MDLKRVALAYYNKSDRTAAIFSKEVLKRLNEIDKQNIKQYLINLINKLPNDLNQADKSSVSEDALMYSTIFNNYALNEFDGRTSE